MSLLFFKKLICLVRAVASVCGCHNQNAILSSIQDLEDDALIRIKTYFHRFSRPDIRSEGETGSFARADKLRSPERVYFGTICFLVVAASQERERERETVSPAFSPAGLVTRLNRHGYFISHPPRRGRSARTTPRATPETAGQGWAPWMDLGRQASIGRRSRVLLLELAALSRVPCGTPLFAKLLTRQIYRAVACAPDGPDAF